MDAARINLAYLPNYDTLKTLMNDFYEACKNKQIKCPLIIDLQGPSIRIGDLPDNQPISLKKGNEISITTNRHLDCSDSLIYCNCEKLPSFVKPGQKIIIDKGNVYLTVKSVIEESQQFVRSNTISKTPVVRKLLLKAY